MNINKAIKKQNKSYKRFRLFMCFVFFILPVVLFIANEINVFFIIYLLIIEALILICLAVKKRKETLIVTAEGYNIKIRQGFPIRNYNISCERVVIVHAENSDKEMRIVVVCKSRFRNKRINAIGVNFFKFYPYVGYEYAKIKQLHPNEEFFYFVIKEGGYKKYTLLNELFKACTNAIFTENAITQIKVLRNP